MSEPRYISPMLDGFTLGQSISEHSGVECYPAVRTDSEKRYIVKKISLPASQVQVEALLLTGVYRDSKAVQDYYAELAHGVADEAQILDQLAGQRGFVPYQSCQIEPMEDGIGCDVFLLSRYRRTLARHMRRNPMTHLGALNLGIDMCAALAVSREAGWLYVDLKPENIFLFGDQEYRLGDLGFVSLDSLEYASLPDRYRSLYTAPEVADAYSSLNATMDTYALGLVLYQIYNEGKLPFKDAEERKAWLERLSGGEVMDAPRCADAEMAGIIMKACAYDPAERWQTPAEMGHALISYMQRNGAEDIPISLPVQPEPETVPETGEAPSDAAVTMEGTPEQVPETTETAEEAPEAPADPAEAVEESTQISSETTESVEENLQETTESDSSVEEFEAADSTKEDIVEELPTVQPVSEEIVEETVEAEPSQEAPVEEASVDWIDLMDAFLAEEESDADPAESEAEPEPSLRQLLGDTDEVLAEVPEVSDDDATADAADILTAANELIEHEAPAPVTPAEAIDVPIPEPIPLEPAEEAQEETGEAAASAEVPAPAEAETDDTQAHPGTGIGKKLLRTFSAVAIIAALAFALWYGYQNYYLQSIDSMTYEGTATQVTVLVDTDLSPEELIVICQDTYGNTTRGTLENGAVTFPNLVPGSQYFISLEPVGFHKLTGTTSITYSTPAETKVIHLTAVTGQEAGSAIVTFGVEGLESDQWTVVCTADGLEPVTVTFSGHSVTIPGLNVGSDYIITLSAESDVLLVGETTISHTASDLIQAQNLILSDYRSGQMTLSWSAPEGVQVDRWIVRCYNSEGYDQLQEVSQTQAVFQEIADGGKYTVEVTASNMTLGIRSEFTADSSSITGFTAAFTDGSIALDWNYSGPTPEGGWKILWSADGGDNQVLTAEDSHAVLSPAVPGSSYSFTIQPPEDSGMTAPTAELAVPGPGIFSANSLNADTVIVTMHDVPTKSGWGYSALKRSKEKDTFSAGGKLALLYTVTKPYDRYDSTEFETIFAIRDSEGHLVSASARTRTWKTMWDNGYCTETVSNLPAAPGSYTLTILIDGGVLAEVPFSIK